MSTLTFDLQESSGKIELKYRDPVLVEKVLEYFYTGDYTLRPCGLEFENMHSSASAADEKDFTVEEDSTTKAENTAE